jgi:hypothetical protein
VAKLEKWIAVASAAGARGVDITLIGGANVSLYQPLEIGDDYVGGSWNDSNEVDAVVTYHSIAVIRPMGPKPKGF